MAHRNPKQMRLSLGVVATLLISGATQAAGELDPDVFVPSYYRARYPALGLQTDADAQAHWEGTGISRGLQGSASFSPSEYRALHPAVGNFSNAIHQWTSADRGTGTAGRRELPATEFFSEATRVTEAPGFGPADPETPDVPPVLGSSEDWALDRIETATLPDQRQLRVVILAPDQSTGPVVDVAPPATGANLYQWLKSAALQARTLKARELRLPPGSYTVTIPAGTAGPHWNLTGLSNLVIDGRGAKLIFTEAGRSGIEMNQNTRVVLRNLDIDWSLRVASAGVIENDASSGQKVLRYTPAYSVTPESAVIKAVTHYSITAKKFVRSSSAEVYFTDSNRPVYDAAAGVFRSPLFSGFFAGQQFIARHYLYDGHAIYVSGKHTSDISFENVRVFSGPGMAFVFYQAGRGFRLSGCKVIRDDSSPSRLISTVADAVHVSSIEGDLLIEDSEFAFMGDDGLNIESKTARVSSVSRQSNGFPRVVFANNGVRVQNGDVLHFFNDGMGLVGKAVVTSLSETSGTTTVGLDRTVDPLAAGVLVRNLKFVSGRFLIKNNSFHDHRARGMLIQAPNGMVIGNQISNTTRTGINLTSDSRAWMEGVGAQNVAVVGNTIASTGWQSGTPQIGALSIFSEHSSGLAVSPQHQSLLISGNTFSTLTGPAVFMASARGVRVVDNVIENANQASMTSHYGVSCNSSIAITRSQQVVLTGNTRSGSSRAQAVDASTTGAITLQPGF